MCSRTPTTGPGHLRSREPRKWSPFSIKCPHSQRGWHLSKMWEGPGSLQVLQSRPPSPSSLPSPHIPTPTSAARWLPIFLVTPKIICPFHLVHTLSVKQSWRHCQKGPSLPAQHSHTPALPASAAGPHLHFPPPSCPAPPPSPHTHLISLTPRYLLGTYTCQAYIQKYPTASYMRAGTLAHSCILST